MYLRRIVCDAERVDLFIWLIIIEAVVAEGTAIAIVLRLEYILSLKFYVLYCLLVQIPVGRYH